MTNTNKMNGKYSFMEKHLTNNIVDFENKHELIEKFPKCFVGVDVTKDESFRVSFSDDIDSEEVLEFIEHVSCDDVLRVFNPSELKDGNLSIHSLLERKASITNCGFVSILKHSLCRKGKHIVVKNRVLIAQNESRFNGPFIKTKESKIIVGDGSIAITAKNFIKDICIFELDSNAKGKKFLDGSTVLINEATDNVYLVQKKTEGKYSGRLTGKIIDLTNDTISSLTIEELKEQGYVDYTLYMSTDSQERSKKATYFGINNSFSGDEIIELMNRMSEGCFDTILAKAENGKISHDVVAKDLNRFGLIASGGAPLCALKKENIQTLKNVKGLKGIFANLGIDLPDVVADGHILARLSYAKELLKLSKEEVYRLAMQIRIVGYGIHKGQLIIIGDKEFEKYLELAKAKGMLDKGIDNEKVFILSDQNGRKLEGPCGVPTLHVMALCKETNSGHTAHQIIEQCLIHVAESAKTEKEAFEAVNNTVKMFTGQAIENLDKDFKKLFDKKSDIQVFNNVTASGDLRAPFVDDLLKVFGDNIEEGTTHPARVKSFFSGLLGKVESIVNKFHIEFTDEKGNNLIGSRVVSSDPTAVLLGGILKAGEIIDVSVSKKIAVLENKIKELEEVDEAERDEKALKRAKKKLKKFLKNYGSLVCYKQPTTQSKEYYKALVLSMNEIVKRINTKGKALVERGELTEEELQDLIDRVENSPEKVYVPAIEWIIKLLAGMDFDWDKVIVCYACEIKDCYKFNNFEDAFIIDTKVSKLECCKSKDNIKTYEVANVKKMLADILKTKFNTEMESIGGLTYNVNKIQRIRLMCLTNWKKGSKYARHFLNSLVKNHSVKTSDSYRKLVGKSSLINVEFVDRMIKAISIVEWNRENVVEFFEDASKALRLYQEGTIDAPKKLVYFINRIIVACVEIQSLATCSSKRAKDDKKMLPYSTIEINKKTDTDENNKKKLVSSYTYNPVEDTIVKDKPSMEVMLLDDSMSEIQDEIVKYYNSKVVEFYNENKDDFRISEEFIITIDNAIETLSMNDNVKTIISKVETMKKSYNTAMRLAIEEANKVVEDAEIEDTDDISDLRSSYVSMYTDSLKIAIRNTLDEINIDNDERYSLYIKGVILNYVTYYNNFKNDYNEFYDGKFAFNVAPEATLAALIDNDCIVCSSKAIQYNKETARKIIKETGEEKIDIELFNGMSNDLDLEVCLKSKFYGQGSIDKNGTVEVKLDLLEYHKEYSLDIVDYFEVIDFVDYEQKKRYSAKTILGLLSDESTMVELENINGENHLYIVNGGLEINLTPHVAPSLNKNEVIDVNIINSFSFECREVVATAGSFKVKSKMLDKIVITSKRY